MLALLAVLAVVAAPPSVSLARTPPATVGRPWVATLTVRATTAPVVVARLGSSRVSSRPTHVAGAHHRVRLVFPRAGTWTLTARAQGRTFRLGSVVVRPRPFEPGLLHELVIEPEGTLLVLEGRPARLLRVEPASGRVTVVARNLAGAFGLARFPDGTLAIGGDQVVIRLDPATGDRTELARVDPAIQIGPVAVDASNRVFFATNESAVYRLDAGGLRLLAGGLGVPHGIEIAANGTLYVSATERDEIVLLDPETGASTVIASRVPGPLGLAVGPDNTLYVSEFETHSVSRLASHGGRAILSDDFANPMGLAVAPDGTVYVGENNRGIFRLGADGPVRLQLFGP